MSSAKLPDRLYRFDQLQRGMLVEMWEGRIHANQDDAALSFSPDTAGFRHLKVGELVLVTRAPSICLAAEWYMQANVIVDGEPLVLRDYYQYLYLLVEQEDDCGE